MNLFVEALADHITSTWDSGLKSEGAHEVRFIVQSLGPSETLSLFEKLGAHADQHYDPVSTGCFFRAAKRLWDAWKESPGGAQAAIHSLEGKGWIDDKDQLTKYRNALAKDHGKEGLVVVLVGLNHATDQGGLADFHLVDEGRIAQGLRGGFRPWLERIGERLDISPGETQLKQFDELLRTLSQLRPLQLGRLASFLEPMIEEGNCFGLDDFRARVLKALPAWDIPPLLPGTTGAVPSGKAALKALKDAEAFISHVGYKTPAKQKRDLAKLEAEIIKEDFALPTRPDGSAEFVDKADYLGCLRAFIERADPVARARLLQVDAMPTVNALRVKGLKPPRPEKESVKGFDDLSLIAFLQALWDALLQFDEELAKDERIDELLGDMTITLVTLEHDHRDSAEDGDADEAARELLSGLLGGLEERLQEIAENLSERWQRQIAIGWETAPEGLKVQPVKGSKRPSLLFRVSVADVEGSLRVEDEPYRWFLDATQPERVRHICIEKVRRERLRLGVGGKGLLPAFRIGKVHLTALFYAADAEEANRLVAGAMQDMTLMDLRAELQETGLSPALLPPLERFIERYWTWLDATLEYGYYKALAKHEPALRQAYSDLCVKLLDTGLTGATDLLRRVYKAFLLVDDSAQPGDPFLACCAAWGLSPSVLELSQAQTCFLRDYFPEALDELAERGTAHGKRVFQRLLSLARMQRPVTVLVKNPAGTLTTRTRDLGLLHCVGEVASGTKSLAVQTLLKEDDDGDDDEELTRVLRPCAEQRIVRRVLDLYTKLHDYAADGLRILAVNVADLSVILLGVEQYLQAICMEHPDYPPFECALMVYSSAASPLAMENRLSRWRERVLASCKEDERPLLLTVGHRYAPRELVVDQARKERHRYDLAFLFHFLRADMEGKIEAAPAFNVPSDATSSFFPISEYPRPIQADQPEQREMLLSNRRLMVQTRHADLSARLHYQGDRAPHHLVLGQVGFNAWAEPVKVLHERAQWVACIDPFVDKRLLGARRLAPGQNGGQRRKIVGFESGLGDYGELNLTISTEQDTLERLMQRVAGELSVLLPHAPAAANSQAAARIVAQAEKIAGLASLRAVLGDGQQIREVVGYGAIKRMLKPGDALISQLLPLDAMQNWLAEPAEAGRPDLLQLSLTASKDGMPHIQATVIECKVAGQNSVHTAKALRQVRSGLFQLSRVLAPRCKLFAGLSFDRRYWWAQLQRAIASRSEVRLSAEDWTNLNAALERVAEGQYSICWQGMVFTFWSDVPGPLPEVIAHQLTEQVVPTSVRVPGGFCIEQVVLGYQGLTNLFASSEVSEELKVEPTSPAICIRYDDASDAPSREVAPPEDMTLEDEPVEDAEDGDEDLDDSAPGPEEAVAAMLAPVASRSAVAEPPAAEPPAAEPQPAEPTPSGSGDTQASAAAEAPIDLDAPSGSPVPERILVGTRANGEPVYWYFGRKELENRHLLVFGKSGTGKTYGVQCLLAEMAVAGMRSLIIDYTDGFLPAQMEPRFQAVARPRNHFVIAERLPLNPFRRQRQVIDPSLPVHEETNYQVASRIVSIFASVYAVGEQQLAALSRSLQKGMEIGSGFSLDALLPILGEDSPQGLSLANKIEPFIQARPFHAGTDSAWEDMLGTPEHGVHVLQLKGLARETQRMVTEFVLWDLWDYAQNAGSKDQPLPIVLDEIQNLDHGSDSPIDKMLREGRKFGVALILATQTTSNFNAEQRDRLFQAGHKLFFKPADTEIDRFTDILSKATAGVSRADWADRLARLEKGQCWSLGPAPQANGAFKQVATLVKVTALEQRFNAA
jgi:DNA phosphorothioation-dependent restriction protein DptH